MQSQVSPRPALAMLRAALLALSLIAAWLLFGAAAGQHARPSPGANHAATPSTGLPALRQA